MTLSITSLDAVMLSVIFAECRVFNCYAVRHYAECRYAECRGTHPLPYK
jgi:hypothetical protein